jgi:hypothetical protein
LRLGFVLASAVLVLVALSAGIPTARGDSMAYVVNVTLRPGYGCVNAGDALAYGQGVCAKVSDDRPYADIVADIKSDLRSGDEYQASYLIAQAVNELCPALIWQLRNSAAHDRPLPG